MTKDRTLQQLFDLTGKVALMFRFEPMDEDGVSLWSQGGRWSGRAGFNGKLRAARERGHAREVGAVERTEAFHERRVVRSRLVIIEDLAESGRGAGSRRRTTFPSPDSWCRRHLPPGAGCGSTRRNPQPGWRSRGAAKR